jgi:hypothetical protein
MAPWWRNRREKPYEPEESVADECEAFLVGTYWFYLTARRREPPLWTYINRLAHAAPDAVLALAGAPETLTPERVEEPVLDWLDVEGAVADQVVALTHGDLAEIRELQRRVLIPLELALASEPNVDKKLGPHQLVALARAALFGHPSGTEQAA